MRFGKLAPREDSRTLRLSALLTPGLPPAPASFNALPRVEAATKVKDPSKLFPMLGNDRAGDCTIAAAAHAETLWNGYCGKLRKPSKAAVLNEYFGLTGGRDTGLVMLDVCNHWRQQGITGEKILAFAGVDRRRHDLIRQAIYLFGGLYLGFNVTEQCIQQFNQRQPWTPGPLTGEGHSVWAYAYTPMTLSVLTWGSTQMAGWDWFDSSATESFAIIPREGTLASFEPGLDLAALKSALAQVTA